MGISFSQAALRPYFAKVEKIKYGLSDDAPSYENYKFSTFVIQF